MDPAWAAWVDGSLHELEDRHLTRVLRSILPSLNAVQASIHEEQLDAWLRGAPASSDPRTLPALAPPPSPPPVGRQQQLEEAWPVSTSTLQQQQQQQKQGGVLRPLRMFGLNDYMGLSTHPDVCRAAADAALAAGMGPRSSALVCGFTTEHRALELELARLKGTEDALLFPTGYAANMAVVSVFASAAAAAVPSGQSGSTTSSSTGSSSGSAPGVVIFSDELNHASIIDGARLALRGSVSSSSSSSSSSISSSINSGGGGSSRGGGSSASGRSGAAAAAAAAAAVGAGVSLRVYRHGDLQHLEQLLRAAPAGSRKIVVTDGLFSMDGDFADLRGLARLRRRYGFLLVVDDAHATLVCGQHGGGTAEMQRAPPGSVDIHVGTLSKAFGCLGGFAACSSRVRSLLINRGRAVIFSTAPPLPVVAAARAALRVSQRESWRRRHLWALVRHLSARLGVPAHSPVIPIVIGPEADTMEAARQLLMRGFHVGAIRPPTVPAGTCRLRVSLSAAHSFVDVDALADALLSVMRAVGRGSGGLAALPHLQLPPPWSDAWLEEQDRLDAAAAAGGGAMPPRSRL